MGTARRRSVMKTGKTIVAERYEVMIAKKRAIPAGLMGETRRPAKEKHQAEKTENCKRRNHVLRASEGFVVGKDKRQPEHKHL